MFFGLFGQKRWNPAGLHCYITGGSTGLGLNLAILLTKAGAHVSIVARNKDNLSRALEQLEAARVSSTQILASYSYSLDSFDNAQAAYDEACGAHNGTPADAVFMCAGSARPGFWIEQDEEDIRRGIDQSYSVTAFTARIAAERMARARHAGKLVLVGSIISYFGLVGYSTYCPGKFAIRGLAETLRQELLLYNISVHMYFPATIDTPHLANENKTKPSLTLKIEESDPILQPDVCAAGLLAGVQRGEFHITDTFNGNAFRTSTRGASPWNGFVKDLVYGLIGFIGIPLWRQGVDKMVRSHTDEHQRYLSERGFFEQPARA
ncbi:oxidoreductase [Peniophora sp. CONT]|nr:oxidoreductase [Peniophora sp. CONT]